MKNTLYEQLTSDAGFNAALSDLQNLVNTPNAGAIACRNRLLGAIYDFLAPIEVRLDDAIATAIYHLRFVSNDVGMEIVRGISVLDNPRLDELRRKESEFATDLMLLIKSYAKEKE